MAHLRRRVMRLDGNLAAQNRKLFGPVVRGIRPAGVPSTAVKRRDAPIVTESSTIVSPKRIFAPTITSRSAPSRLSGSAAISSPKPASSPARSH
jgi:hypothetical protein